MGLFESNSKRMLRQAAKEAEQRGSTLYTLKCPRCGNVTYMRTYSPNATKPCSCGYTLSVHNQVSSYNSHTNQVGASRNSTSSYQQNNSSVKRELTPEERQAFQKGFSALIDFVSNIGKEEEITDPERIATNQILDELLKIEHKIKERKDDLINIANEKIKIFDDYKKCINCGKTHFSKVQICKKCGATNESGTGKRGIVYRGYKLNNTDFRIFKDGFIDIIQTTSLGYNYIKKFDLNNYYEFTISDRDSYKQTGDMLVYDENKQIYYLPFNKTNLHIHIWASGSVEFFKVNKNGAKIGLLETIDRKTIKREIYDENGQLIHKETNDSYFDIVKELIPKIQTLLNN